MLSSCPSGMPGPSSRTVIRTTGCRSCVALEHSIQIDDSGGVYLRALSNRLSSTSLKRRGSTITRPRSSGTSMVASLSGARILKWAKAPAMISSTQAGTGSTGSIPASNLENWSRWSIKPVNRSAAPSISCKNSRFSVCSSLSSLSSNVVAKPFIAVRGIWSSWETVDRSSDFSRSDSSALSRAAATSFSARFLWVRSRKVRTRPVSAFSLNSARPAGRRS